MGDDQQQFEDKHHDNLENMRTDTTSTGSLNENEEIESLQPTPPPETFFPTVVQPQIAFLANAIPGNNGGSMTGSFVLLPPPPPPSSSFVAINNENSTTTSETNDQFQNDDDPPNTVTEPHHHQHHHRLDTGNVNPLPELFGNTTENSYAPAASFASNTPNPLLYSTMVPTGQSSEPQRTPSNNGVSQNVEEETITEPSIDIDTGPVTSYRTRRRKRAEKKEKQKQAKKKGGQSPNDRRFALPPNHRATNTQVWNTGDLNLPSQQQQVRRRQNITLPPHHRATKTQVWNGGEEGRRMNSGDPSVPQVVVLNGVPILYASSSTASNSTPSLIVNGGQPTASTFDPRGQFTTTGIPHHRRTETTDTNITLVGHEILSGGESSNPSSLPSVHYVRGGADRFRGHVHDFVRNSRRMEVVNYEQIERIKMMHDRFADGSKFTFNYNTLLLTASVIAGLGLASNSTTTVIASMLVSPIMGPVVGMAYGATIHDFRLFKTAAITEIFSLLFCIVMGMLLGCCMGVTDLAEDWPTDEMQSRGTWQNFFVALPVAFFSGLGVAVGLLDDQVSSLVGVAISASLLPPAVNSGLLWVSYAFFDKEWWHSYVPEDPVPYQELVDQLYDPFTESHEGVGCKFPDDVNVVENVAAYYRCYFRKAGSISLLLTIANIVIVAIASMIMFRMKERLNIPSKKIFWRDLGTARKIYRNLAVMSHDDNSSEASRIVDGNSDPASDKSDQVSEVRRNIDRSIPEGNEEEVDSSSEQDEFKDLEA